MSNTQMIDKLPRWVLIFGFMGFMGITGITLQGAFADLEQTKDRAKLNEAAIQIIRQDVTHIRMAQEALSQKYDRNQEENQRVFRQILTAVNGRNHE